MRCISKLQLGEKEAWLLCGKKLRLKGLSEGVPTLVSGSCDGDGWIVGGSRRLKYAVLSKHWRLCQSAELIEDNIYRSVPQEWISHQSELDLTWPGLLTRGFDAVFHILHILVCVRDTLFHWKSSMSSFELKWNIQRLLWGMTKTDWQASMLATFFFPFPFQ